MEYDILCDVFMYGLRRLSRVEVNCNNTLYYKIKHSDHYWVLVVKLKILYLKCTLLQHVTVEFAHMNGHWKVYDINVVGYGFKLSLLLY